MNSSLSELRSKEFYSQTFHLMVPVMLQQLITVGINFLDNIMIGSFGEFEIAAVSISNQFYSIFQFMLLGIGGGATVMAAQFWGGHKTEPLRAISAITLRISIILSLLFTLFSVAFPRVLLGMYTNDVRVIEAGIGYTRLLGTTFLMFGVSSVTTSLLRSTTHVKIPLISSIVAFFLNLFFNWVFIFGKLGFPRLETTGAAVGTVIARGFEFLFITGYFLFKDQNIGFRAKDFFMSGKEYLGKFLKFSFPVIVSDTLLGVGLSVVTMIMGHISAAFVAAYSIVNNGNQLLTIVNKGMGGAASVVIGNTLGAGDQEKVYRQGWAYLILSFVFGALCSLVILLVKEPYFTLYTVSEETLETARSLFLYLILFSPMQTMALVMTQGVLRGGGDTVYTMIMETIVLWAFSLPLGALAGLVWHMTPFWTFFFMKIEFSMKGLLSFIRFITKKWIKKIKLEEKSAEA